MPKAGPYFFYMVDFKKEMETELGRTLNMAEVSQMASDSWNSMSDEDKAFYKAKAKGGEVRIGKRSSVNTSGNSGSGGGGSSQLTSHRIPVEIYDRELRQKKADEENMRRRISALTQNNSLLTDFANYSIYLMYGNFFYKDEKTNEYSPAELAIVKFTFADGVLDRFHTFIAPERTALGYAYTAKAHSEATHRLPPPPDAIGVNNFRRVKYDIDQFMGEDEKASDGGKLMVFTLTDTYASEADQIDILKSFLKQFWREDAIPFDLYPLTRLYYTLRKELAARRLVDDIPNERFSEVFLLNDPYETMGGISCMHHEEIDATRHCALSRVHRWSFLLADHFCEPLGIHLIPGTHLPANADVSQSMLSVGSASESEASVRAPTENIGTDDEPKPFSRRFSSELVGSKSQDGSVNLNIRQDIHRSDSTLCTEIQSVRTASSSITVASAEHKRSRPTRSSCVASSGQSHPTSSTFYNP